MEGFYGLLEEIILEFYCGLKMEGVLGWSMMEFGLEDICFGVIFCFALDFLKKYWRGGNCNVEYFNLVENVIFYINLIKLF